MEIKNSKSCDGSDAHRVEVGERGNISLSPNARPNEDGSKGTERPVADMVGSENQAIHEKSQELQLKARKFRDECVNEFLSRAKAKYDKGQEEHGGFLPTDVSLVDAEDEIIDLWFYIQALKAKITLLMPEALDVLNHDRCKNTDWPTRKEFDEYGQCIQEMAKIGEAVMPEVHRNHEEPSIDPYDHVDEAGDPMTLNDYMRSEGHEEDME